MVARSKGWLRAPLGMLLILGGCGAAGSGDASPDGGDGGRDGSSDGEIDAAPDAEVDAEVEAVSGSLSWSMTDARVLTKRLCDFDGDGVEDNAVADLGGATATLFAEYMSARVMAEVREHLPYMIHMPWVEDVAGLTDSDTVAAFLVGQTPVAIQQSGEEIDPEGPFYAAHHALDGCGEPLFTSEHASLDRGSLSWIGGFFPIPFSSDELVVGREPEVRGTLSPGGETLEAEGCLYTTISDLAAESFLMGGIPTTALAVVVGGGRLVGLPTVPGLNPDVDIDGDGLEHFILDEQGLIVGCVDGDRSVIEGVDCWRDPRMADAFGLALSFEARRSTIIGRAPGWERGVGAESPEGPPETSLFDSPDYDSVACAAFEEECEPFAPEPCCEADQVCTGSNTLDYRCFRVGCDPPLCDYAGEPGYCHYTALGRACAPLWRIPESVPPCESGTEGCATTYGATENTLCLELTTSRGNTIWRCQERCSATPGGCELGYSCIPQRFTEDSACVRPIGDK